jgi:hypothetical protein
MMPLPFKSFSLRPAGEKGRPEEIEEVEEIEFAVVEEVLNGIKDRNLSPGRCWQERQPQAIRHGSAFDQPRVRRSPQRSLVVGTSTRSSSCLYDLRISSSPPLSLLH